MKVGTIAHPSLKKPLKVYYAVSDQEYSDQVKEIWRQGAYSSFRPKDGVFLDLGANCGLATLYFYYVLGAKEIHAVEPNPDIYHALRKNVGSLPGVKTYNVAWTNGTGEAMMFSDQYGNKPQSFFETNKAVAQKVHCVSPFNFFRRTDIPHVDVLKIDVEGYEYNLFPDSGFGKISQRIDSIIGESHFMPNGGFPELVSLMLGEWGYKTEFVRLDPPNGHRRFTFSDYRNGQEKNYHYLSNTIFKAWRL